MTIVIREQQQFESNSTGEQASWTLGAGTLTTDLAVVVHADDYYTLAGLTSPGGTAVTTWTPAGSFDGGTNGNHVKVWTGPITTGGAATVTTTSATTDEERAAAVFILYDTGYTVSYDTCTGQQTAAALTSSAPSVTPTATYTNDLLICLWGPWATSASDSYAPPGSMTPYAGLYAGNGGYWRFAYEQLTSDSATGVRTADCGTSQAHMAFSLLIKTTHSPGTTSSPAYATTASALAGGSGTWANPGNADGAPDGTFATWTAP